MKKRKKSPRDVWDILDVLGKIASSVILVIITIVLGYGMNRITASLEKGQLVKDLIDDLTTEPKSTRQDIALITLKHSMSRHDPHLVLDIAAQVFNTREKFDDTTSDVAFEIIRELDPDRAETLALIIAERQHASLRSEPDPTKDKRGISDDAKFVAKAFTNVVYIQYRSEKTRSLAGELQEILNAKKFKAPGIEKVDEEFSNEIRYFHKKDEALAIDTIKNVVEDFFRSRGIEVFFKVLDLSASKLRAPEGQIEIWINLEKT